MKHPSITLLYLQIAIFVASFICAAFLIRKAFNFHEKLWLGVGILLSSTIVFSLLAVHVPLYVMGNSSRIQDHLTADIMMFGSAGLVLIAIIGFAIDHLFEKPTWLMVSAAACIAVGLFPFIYRMGQDSLNSRYEIKIVEPEPPKWNLQAPPVYPDPKNAPRK